MLVDHILVHKIVLLIRNKKRFLMLQDNKYIILLDSIDIEIQNQ